MAQRVRCYVCNYLYSRATMRLIHNFNNDQKTEIASMYRQELNFPALDINAASRVCINCDNLINQDIEALQKPEHLRLHVIKQRSTDSCMICNHVQNGMQHLSIKARVQIYIDTNIYVPHRSRTCPQHLDDSGYLLQIFYAAFKSLHRPIVLSGLEISNFLSNLRSSAAKYQKKSIDRETVTDEDFVYLTSITKEQFSDLYSYCDPVFVYNQFHNISKDSLFFFLIKMRHGLSDELLKIVSDKNTRQNVSRTISFVRKSLTQRFVPENIGLEAINRQNFIDRHVTPFANELYNDNPNDPKAIVLVDGTYSYIQKSGNYRSLRQSFSVHKGRHLVKPVLVVAPDGYILDIHGPYFADGKNNDASILQDQFEKDINDINAWFQDGDIFLVDRGYRDVVPFLENRRYKVTMPPFLEPNENQLTTEMANIAHSVTMQRWVVESRNGHIKTIYKFLDGIIQRAHVLNLRDFYLIAGALINRYRNLIHMPEKTIALARQIKNRMNDVNVLQMKIEAENLARRIAVWEQLNQDHVPEFPMYDLEYLRSITHGPYQLKLSASYIQDKLDHESTDIFQVDRNREEPGLLRFRIYSRFRNSTRYQLWICFQIDDDDEQCDEANNGNFNGPILGYYCQCKAGARTVGCCAHVASVLWYLGWARYQQTIKYPSRALLNYILDAANREGNNDEPAIGEFINDVED